MADLQYTLGLDGAAFARGIGASVRGLGHIGLAMEGLKKLGSGLSAPIMKAAEFEKTKTAINTITKDLSVTEGVMKSLTKLGAETPFEMSQLAPAARMLMGAGTAAHEVAGELRMLGDIAAGADTDIGGLVGVFNQVRGKTKLMGDDFIQLAEQGVSGLREALAKVEQIDVSQVSDQMAAGKVSALDLKAALKAMTSAGGNYFRAMVNQSQTFLGKLSTLSDEWSMLMVDFATPIMDSLKPMVDDATKSVQAMSPFVAQIGQQFGRVVTSVREFVGGLSEGKTLVASMQSAFGALAKDIMLIASVPFMAAEAAMPRVSKAMMAAMPPALAWLENRFESIALRFGMQLHTAIVDMLQGVPDYLLPDSAVDALNDASNNMARAWTALEKRVAGLRAAMEQGGQQAGEHIAKAAVVFNNSLSAAAKTVKETFANAGPGPEPNTDYPLSRDSEPGKKSPTGTGGTAGTGGAGGSRRSPSGGAGSAKDEEEKNRRIKGYTGGDSNSALERAKRRSEESRTKAEQGRSRMGGLKGLEEMSKKPLRDSFKTPGLGDMAPPKSSIKPAPSINNAPYVPAKGVPYADRFTAATAPAGGGKGGAGKDGSSDIVAKLDEILKVQQRFIAA